MTMSKYEVKVNLTNLREELHFDDKDCDDVLASIYTDYNAYAKYLGDDFFNDFITGDNVNELIQDDVHVLYNDDEVACANTEHYFQVNNKIFDEIVISDIDKNDLDHWLLAKINQL